MNRQQMLTPEETRVLRGLLHRERARTAARHLAAGDVAQIRPQADPLFGGMLFATTQVHGDRIRGYLLRPHRGGCHEAWLTLKPTDLQRIGRMPHTTIPEFAARCENLPGCRQLAQLIATRSRTAARLNR